MDSPDPINATRFEVMHNISRRAVLTGGSLLAAGGALGATSLKPGSLVAAPFEMPQRPEFFMGGGGAFSTPQDYLKLLHALVNGGSLNRVRILAPETVATMMINQIGDLNVHEMRSAHPEYSNSFDQFPGQPHKWGFSFDINERPGPNGRSAGSASWAGLLNCYFWLDPVKKVTGALFTQILPFFDARVVSLYGEFERGLYRGFERT